MHAREIVFEPFDAQSQRDAGADPVLLRARKELLEPGSKWCVYQQLFWLRSEDNVCYATGWYIRI